MKESNIDKKKNKYNGKKIALIGHMGSGKSILGKLIAKKLKLIHIDSDKLIEDKTKKTINEIFNIEGEENFRIIEENIILNLKNKNNFVLSLGGGSILSLKVRKFLLKDFITVFLDVEINELVQRLKNSSKRPLLITNDIEKKIKELDIIRRQYYLLADIKLKNFKTLKDTFLSFIVEYKRLYEKNN